jgi:hypothetical protein
MLRREPAAKPADSDASAAEPEAAGRDLPGHPDPAEENNGAAHGQARRSNCLISR